MVKRKSKSQPEIPTASMADVAFLLIIFFLVTTSFMKEKGLPLELPNTEKAKEAAETKKKNHELYVTKKEFLLNTKKVEFEDLRDAVERLLVDAQSEMDRIVILRTDKKASYERFVMAQDVLQQTDAITTIELTDEGEGVHIEKKEIKKVDLHGEIEAKMAEKEDEVTGEETEEEIFEE